MRILGGLLLALSACAAVQPEAEDRRIGAIPPDVNDWWFDASADGSVVAYADRRGPQVRLTVGDRRYGPYT